jgi:hypothetical protein
MKDPAPFTLWTLAAFDDLPRGFSYARLSPKTRAISLDPSCLYYDTYSGRTNSGQRFMDAAAAYVAAGNYQIT